jgi:hypothetical protein
MQEPASVIEEPSILNNEEIFVEDSEVVLDTLEEVILISEDEDDLLNENTTFNLPEYEDKKQETQYMDAISDSGIFNMKINTRLDSILVDCYDFKTALICEDRIEMTSSIERLLISPPPEKTSAFEFVNAAYENDPDDLVLGLTTVLSRTGTPDAEIIEGLYRCEMLPLTDEMLIIRATSPKPVISNTVISAEPEVALEAIVFPKVDVDNLEENSVIAPEIILVAQEEAPIEPEIEEPKVPEANREELISNIKHLLEQREKTCNRNAVLQNKLSDYFKRKRNDDVRDGEKTDLDQELRYDQCMASLNDLRSQFNSINTTNKKIVTESKTKVNYILILSWKKGHWKSRLKVMNFRNIKGKSPWQLKTRAQGNV